MCKFALMLTTALTSNGPNSQGLGWRKRCQIQASRAPAGNNTASQRQSTVAGCVNGTPSPSRYLKAAGTQSTTTSTRRLCPAATRLSTAPLRAPRLTISPEPPGMLEKNAVARSSPVRCSNQTPTTADRLVTRAPKKIRPKWLMTCSITTGVKCRPMPMPTIHWPHLRPPGISANCQGVRQRTRMIASNEPTIQGSGQPIWLAR
ncbi:hypothetical protein D3C84_404270 [compost metagenome]